MAIDRYLWYMGRKQLFGMQFGKKSSSDTCFCSVPVEVTFSEAMRVSYTGKTLTQLLEQINSVVNPPSCKISYCDFPLQASPAGTVPGFW